MDVRIKMYIFSLIALGSAAVVSAQAQCYVCQYEYTDSETESDPDNCKVPSSSTNTETCPSSSDQCAVQSTVNPTIPTGSSFTPISGASLPNPRGITYTRGCIDPAGCNDDCRKNPETCTKCCTNGNNCNSATFMSHLDDNALTQTCYRCQYSEIPGQRSDTGCGLAFDATSSTSQVYEIECPGLCFSAKARFEHVEEIIRGCIYDGDLCSYDGLLQYGVPASVVNGRDSVFYDLACCNGDRCNPATALAVGIVAVLSSTLLGMLVIQL